MRKINWVGGEVMASRSTPRTKYFSLSEWERMVGLRPEAEPYPRAWVGPRWRPLALMLDRIRERAGEAITVTPNGGYRGREHNRAVGGSAQSQHMFGRAADIVAVRMSARRLHALVERMYRDGELPELGGLGRYPRFVHIDTRPRDRRTIAMWDETGDGRREQEA